MHYDVVIVGGGLVGCCCALALAKSDVRVLVLETGQLNRQASGRNAGSLHFQLEHRLLEDSSGDGLRAAPMMALNVAAIEDWRALSRDAGDAIGVTTRGGLMVAFDNADERLLEKKIPVEKRYGLDIDIVNGAEARRIAPYLSDEVVAAAFCPVEGHVDPRLATIAAAKLAEEAGADFCLRHQVVRVDRGGGRWRVDSQTPNHGRVRVTADIVVNAAGANAPQVARLCDVHLPLRPVPLQMNVTDAAPAFMPHLIQHVSKNLSLKQVRAGNVVIGGGWPATLDDPDHGLEAPTAGLIEDSVIGNLKIACQVSPQIQHRNLIRTWTGVATLTDDQLPLLGPIDGVEAYYVAVGGSGFTLGPTYARLLSEMIVAGEPSMDITPFLTARYGASPPDRTAGRHAHATD